MHLRKIHQWTEIRHAARIDDASQAGSPSASAIADIVLGLRKIRIAHVLAVDEVRHRYRRSILGPFWLTISLLIWLLTVSFVFSRVFNMSLVSYLPHVAIGMLAWNFISQTLGESCFCLANNQEYLKSAPLPYSLFAYKTVLYNLYISLHNLIVIGAIVAAVRGEVGVTLLSVVPATFLLVVNLTWMVLVLAMACCRFRDLPQIVANALQIAFYITPIVWFPSLLAGHETWFLKLNIFYYMVEFVRSPLLGHSLSAGSWFAGIAFAVAGWSLAVFLLTRWRSRLSYWIS
ncbi:MAG: ABC transporter permease [Xanthobacteraceae bacterium]|nr:ABC transporter permease [Xanthobacteraceae bacterium]